MQKSYVDLVKTTSNKIVCVGKNYIKHVLEMGGTQVPS